MRALLDSSVLSSASLRPSLCLLTLVFLCSGCSTSNTEQEWILLKQSTHFPCKLGSPPPNTKYYYSMNQDSLAHLREALPKVRIRQTAEETIKQLGSPAYEGTAYKPTMFRGLVKVGKFYDYEIKRVGERSDSLGADDRYVRVFFSISNQLVSLDSCAEGIASKP